MPILTTILNCTGEITGADVKLPMQVLFPPEYQPHGFYQSLVTRDMQGNTTAYNA